MSVAKTEETVLPALSSEDRAALRAYLQRSEVRLSTMHRIGGAFLSGAGLLFLIPVFFRDGFNIVFNEMLENAQGWNLIILVVLLGATAFLPLCAFYLLVRDIIVFYFVPHHFKDGLEHSLPRFALTGIAFSEAESLDVKNVIRQEQMIKDARQFIVPRREVERQMYQALYSKLEAGIVSQERRDRISEYVRTHPEDRKAEGELQAQFAIFGLAGTQDRTLIEEAAKMEMSLSRHTLSLRHLVLRYAKALLVFLVTTVVLTVFAGALTNLDQLADEIARSAFGGARVPRWSELLLALTFISWAALVPIAVRLPLRWIQVLGDQNNLMRIDAQLKKFESVSIAIAVGAFGLAMYFAACVMSSMFPQLAGFTWFVAVSAFLGFTGWWVMRSYQERLPDQSK